MKETRAETPRYSVPASRRCQRAVPRDQAGDQDAPLRYWLCRRHHQDEVGRASCLSSCPVLLTRELPTGLSGSTSCQAETISPPRRSSKEWKSAVSRLAFQALSPVCTARSDFYFGSPGVLVPNGAGSLQGSASRREEPEVAQRSRIRQGRGAAADDDDLDLDD